MDCKKVLEHKGGVLCCTFSKSGSYIVSGCQDRTIHLWNSDTGKQVAVFDGHAQSVRDLQCSNDSSQIVSVGQDKYLLCWDVSRSVVSRKIRAHDADINSVRYNPENTLCITCSADKKVNVWDMRSRSYQPVQTMADAKDGVTCLSVSTHEIAASSLDGCVRQYDVRAGKLRTDKIGGLMMGVSYSNDSNCLLVMSLDSKCRLFDKLNGELLNEYKGHRNIRYKSQSIFSNDDSMVISGSEDNQVYLYDLVEANVKYVLKGHTHLVSCLAYSPVSDVIVSGSMDRHVRVWERNAMFK